MFGVKAYHLGIKKLKGSKKPLYSKATVQGNPNGHRVRYVKLKNDVFFERRKGDGLVDRSYGGQSMRKKREE